jgi:uncharacterized protein YciI
MFYAVVLAFDPGNAERRLELRPAHRESLKDHKRTDANNSPS